MGEIHKRLVIYRTGNDKRPFIEWIGSLKDSKVRGIIKSRLDRLENAPMAIVNRLEKALRNYEFISGRVTESILERTKPQSSSSCVVGRKAPSGKI